jgi:cyclopropane fatty-acyl-phospholipid synthase-like methyltransferase
VEIEGPFDRIVSVGMFEHVGVPNYARFFQKIRELLRPDGLETGTRNEHFHALFRTRRPSHICEMPRCRAILSVIHMLRNGVRTGWLGI